MSFRSALTLASALGLSALVASPLSAQDSISPWWHEDQEVRAVASINIPLGHRRTLNQPAYTLDFTLQARTQTDSGVDGSPTKQAGFEARRERFRDVSRIAFSFGEQPSLMINGQPVATFRPTLNAQDRRSEKRSGLSTAEKVLIGVGVIGGLVVFTATQVNDDLADLSDINLP